LSFRITTASDPAAFGSLWPSLSAPGDGDCHIFQTQEIIAHWRATIGAARKAQPVFLRVDNENGAPLLLLALAIERRRGARVLTWIDGGVSDYNTPILFPASRGGVDANTLWRKLLTALPPFDAALLDKMPGATNPMAALAGAPSAPSGYCISLSGTWSDYAAQRLHRPKDSRRKMRRLAEAGATRVTIARDQADVDRLFPVLIAHKTRRYLELNGEDGFDRPGYRDYIVRLTNDFAVGGCVQLSALEVDKEVLAVHWGLIWKKRFYCLILAYADHALAQYSPARLLVEQLVAWCFEQGIETFDLGHGDAPWKRLFAPERLQLFHAALATNPLGWAYLEARKLRDRWRDAGASHSSHRAA
jgi:CelD/BcsL family acetyltransferase involved in cellulose biosynthesis